MIITNEIVIAKSKLLGFDLVGFAKAEELNSEYFHLMDWLKQNYNSSMSYMEKYPEKRLDVKNILPSAKSVISLGINYYLEGDYSSNKNLGKISRYAWGKDYHLIIWKKLDELILYLKNISEDFEAKSFVDTGPVMDKAWAVRAGLGWMGKNSNIINKKIGSWFFIANIITNNQFNYSNQIKDFCGTCTACIDACPTKAIAKNFVVDANKCISYHTIENKNDIPFELKGKFDNWIFGCDICQECCPWNKKFSTPSNIDENKNRRFNKELNIDKILNMNEQQFSTQFKETPLKRTKLKGLKRNAKFLIS